MLVLNMDAGDVPLLREVPGVQQRAWPSFAVHVAEGRTEPLALRSDAGRFVASIGSAGLNRPAVVRWLERHEIPLLTEAPAGPRGPLSDPLVRLATLVVCVDPRVRDLAALYARSIGADLREARAPEDVVAEIEQSRHRESVSLFVLNDRLEERLCQAVAEGNRRRRIAGRAALSYGFLSAFTPAQLAWLIVKSWALFLQPRAESAGFAQWDFSTPRAVVRVRSARTGATRSLQLDAPWIADSVAVLGLRAHGASFDAAMGRVALCGHLDPPLPRERTLRAPSCFHDGVCFRMKAAQDAPTELLKAVDASPLFGPYARGGRRRGAPRHDAVNRML